MHRTVIILIVLIILLCISVAIFTGLIPIPDMLEEEIKDNVKKESRSKHKNKSSHVTP